ncbi:hypothetical protein CspeluHIS016_0202600 [Cutaneotrichosporon spelunceum]|uniref:alanine--glyoxylate transaminase n=1 Tax=Cutaneotrichosporon spelunceum TaxID=1672016 RepID=A0AAD3TR95_9TREE|nr:hypothetical protein CspeluHIS016_0202600 [Cutaneotrichosporon spelunceum]
MSSAQSFKQAPHKLLVIPGPIEVADQILYANASPSVSHVSPAFVPIFGDCLRMLRKILYAEKTGQPFMIAGSGTLGWDQTGANLVEPGENVVVLNHGYFGDSFADCLQAYGANVTVLKAPVGGIVGEDDLVATVKEQKPKLVTITHVDTSTGVLSPVARYAELIHKASPDTLIAIDAVCAAGSEEIRFDDWGLDVVITAPQKGLGVPPGLSLVMASKKALDVLNRRKAPVTAYYCSWRRWLPIMEAYEAGQAKYFATPPVQLVTALRVGLKQILEDAPKLEERFQIHKDVSNYVKDELEKMGCGFVPLDRANSANGMTAARYPKGITAADVLGPLAERDIVVAGGLHKDIASEYFRVGHMGVTAVDKSRGDVDKILKNVKEVLDIARAKKA